MFLRHSSRAKGTLRVLGQSLCHWSFQVHLEGGGGRGTSDTPYPISVSGVPKPFIRSCAFYICQLGNKIPAFFIHICIMWCVNLKLLGAPEWELQFQDPFAGTMAQVCVCTRVHIRDFSGQYWVQKRQFWCFFFPLVFLMNFITIENSKPWYFLELLKFSLIIIVFCSLPKVGKCLSCGAERSLLRGLLVTLGSTAHLVTYSLCDASL